jgi:large subunit ribosomal protein L31e
MSSNNFDERVVTIPLRDVFAVPSYKRSKKAMSIIRQYLAKHFKVSIDEVKLDSSINEFVWARGQKHPPRKIRIRAAKFEEDGKSVVEAEHAV